MNVNILMVKCNECKHFVKWLNVKCKCKHFNG